MLAGRYHVLRLLGTAVPGGEGCGIHLQQFFLLRPEPPAMSAKYSDADSLVLAAQPDEAEPVTVIENTDASRRHVAPRDQENVGW